MNERTLELAKEAGLKVESFMTNPPKPFQILGSTEQFEKFAELLLVEYKKVILTMINNSHGDFDTLDQALTEINEHFGVEE